MNRFPFKLRTPCQVIYLGGNGSCKVQQVHKPLLPRNLHGDMRFVVNDSSPGHDAIVMGEYEFHGPLLGQG